MSGVPSLADFRQWCNLSPQAISDAQLEQVIAAEVGNQARVCRTPLDPAALPEDLAQALYRRVAREVSGKQVPLGLVGDTASEYGPARLATFDAEVERLEGPSRLVVFG